MHTLRRIKGGYALPSGIRPPTDPYGPLCTILGYPILIDGPKNFSRGALAPIYTNFQGGARAEKKRYFLVKIFKIVQKKTLLWTFLSKFCLRRRNFGQNRVFLLVWEISENQFDRAEKKTFDKISKNFLKIRQPL